MLVFIDEDVPASVARFLRERGHDVQLVRDRFLPGTADHIIARAASEEGAVVVTWNYNHFSGYANRRQESGVLRYPGMSLVAFRCPKPDGRARIERALPIIEAFHTEHVVSESQRMIAIVNANSVRFDDF